MSAPDSPAPEEIRHLDDEWRQRRRRIDVLAGDSALDDDFLTSFKAAYHHLKRNSPVEMSQFFPPLHAMLDAYHLVRPALDQLTQLHRYRDHSAEETRCCYPAEARALARDCLALLGLMRDSRASLAPHVEPDYRRNLEDRFDRFEHRARDLVAALEEGAVFAEQLQALLSGSADGHDWVEGGVGGGEGIRRDLKPGYKQTEVGVIPEDWEVKALGEFCDFSTGIGLLKGEIHSSGRIPAIPYTALYTDFSEVVDFDRIKWFTNDPAASRVVNEPCVLIASSSNMAENTGKASALLGHTPVAIGREVIIIKPQGNPSYISHLLSSPSYRKKTLSLSKGTTIKHVYTVTFHKYQISVPTLAEQEAIATALSDADALIDSLEQLIAKKRLLKQGGMQDLLTGKRRLPGFEGEWKVKRLGDVADVVMGQSPSSAHYNRCGDGVPLIQGNADIEDRKTIRRVFTTEITKNGRMGDILMSVRAPVGEIARATFDVCLGRGVCAIRYSNDFLYHLLISMEPEWAKLSKGSTFDSVNSTDVKEFPLMIPSDTTEQTAIAAILSDMDAELAALEAKLAKARQVKQGMMQELLTGKTRLV